MEEDKKMLKPLSYEDSSIFLISLATEAHHKKKEQVSLFQPKHYKILDELSLWRYNNSR